MKTKMRNFRRMLAGFLLLSVLCLAAVVPAFAKTTNKVLRVKVDYTGKKFSESQPENYDACTFDLGIFNTSMLKVGKTIELSGDLMVPTKLFKSNTSYMEICTNFGINDSKETDYSYLAGIDNTRVFTLTGNGKTKVFNNLTGKSEKSSKNFTVKKKSGYYVIHFVDTITVGKNNIFNGTKKDFAGKKVNPGMYVILSGSGMKAGYVYADNLQIKTGSKTVKVTFNKKDYRNWSHMWRGDWSAVLDSPKAKVVKSPI